MKEQTKEKSEQPVISRLTGKDSCFERGQQWERAASTYLFTFFDAFRPICPLVLGRKKTIFWQKSTKLLVQHLTPQCISVCRPKKQIKAAISHLELCFGHNQSLELQSQCCQVGRHFAIWAIIGIVGPFFSKTIGQN
jgi:hypothetical protein